MTETLTRRRAAPRKRDADATRAAILESAKSQFASLGYDRASLREIAAEAGADMALIKRYFGGKEALFVEALKASLHPDRMQGWDRKVFPQEMAEMLADNVRPDGERTHGFQFLLRAATSPTTAPLLNVAIQDRFLGTIRDWLGGDDAEPRARVFAAVFIGFLVERLVRDAPLTGREREIFVARASAIFQALIRGDGL
jgi:AcrR family transcriptional regulator